MSTFSVHKNIVISAPLERVLAAVRDFRVWPQWSPWLIADPACRISHAEDGLGYAWDGKIAGAGSLRITAEEAPRRIRYRLTFLRPWKSAAEVGFAFAGKDAGVEVTWTMDGSLPFFLVWMKGMMTSFMGMDYERGLAMLKDFVETGSVPSRIEFIGRQSYRGFGYVGLPTRCPIAEIGTHMREGFAKLQAWMREQDLECVGKPFSICQKWDLRKRITEFTPGCPVEDAPVEVPVGFVAGQLPDFHAYSVKHTGPYRHLGNAWAAGMMHARARVFARDKRLAPFEIYESDPNEVPGNEVVTVVRFPAK